MKPVSKERQRLAPGEGHAAEVQPQTQTPTQSTAFTCCNNTFIKSGIGLLLMSVRRAGSAPARSQGASQTDAHQDQDSGTDTRHMAAQQD